MYLSIDKISLNGKKKPINSKKFDLAWAVLLSKIMTPNQ